MFTTGIDIGCRCEYCRSNYGIKFQLHVLRNVDQRLGVRVGVKHEKLKMFQPQYSMPGRKCL